MHGSITAHDEVGIGPLCFGFLSKGKATLRILPSELDRYFM